MSDEIKCVKVKFANEKFANQYIEKIKAKPIPQGSYFCKNCNCWHLTKGKRKREINISESEKIKELKKYIIRLETRITELNYKLKKYNASFINQYLK